MSLPSSSSASRTLPYKNGDGAIHLGNDRGAERLSRMSPEERKKRLDDVATATAWLPAIERERLRSDIEAEIAQAEKIEAARAAREAKKAAKAAEAKSAAVEPEDEGETTKPAPPTAPEPPAAPKTASADGDDNYGHFNVGGKRWDPKTNPIT